MSEPLNCPHCDGILTDQQVISLHRRYASAQRKTKSGGKNGGRPPMPRPDMPHDPRAYNRTMRPAQAVKDLGAPFVHPTR